MHQFLDQNDAGVVFVIEADNTIDIELSYALVFNELKESIRRQIIIDQSISVGSISRVPIYHASYNCTKRAPRSCICVQLLSSYGVQL